MDGFRPHTPREALLAVRYMVSRVTPPEWSDVKVVCEEGLDELAPANFELADQLADRLAEAHNILRGLVEGMFEGDDARGDDLFSPEFKSKFYEALALPPDLEAMVERRIGPR